MKHDWKSDNMKPCSITLDFLYHVITQDDIDRAINDGGWLWVDDGESDCHIEIYIENGKIFSKSHSKQVNCGDILVYTNRSVDFKQYGIEQKGGWKIYGVLSSGYLFSPEQFAKHLTVYENGVIK